jgi:hypothetical protein
VAVAGNHPLAAAGASVQLKGWDETWVVLKPEAAVRQMIVTAAAVAGYTARDRRDELRPDTARACGRQPGNHPPSPFSRLGRDRFATIEVGQPALSRTVAAAWRADTSRPSVAAALLEQCRAACGGG